VLAIQSLQPSAAAMSVWWICASLSAAAGADFGYSFGLISRDAECTSMKSFSKNRPAVQLVALVVLTNSLGLTTAQTNGLLDDQPPQDAKDSKSGPKAVVFKKKMNRVTDVAWSPDGKRIAIAVAAYVDRGKVQPGLKVWDAATGEEVPLVPDEESSWVQCATFSPDSRRLAFGNDNEIDIRDIQARKRVLLLEESSPVFCLAYSPDGKRLASGTGRQIKMRRRDEVVRIWDAFTGKEQLRLEGHTDSILSVAFSPDGKLLASGSDDGTARLWNAETGKPLFTLKGDNTIDRVAFSPDGKRLAAAGGRILERPNNAKIWEVETGKELLLLKGHRTSVSGLAFSPDGKLLVTGSQEVKLWDPATGREKQTLERVTGGVRKLVFAPDGKRLMAANAARSPEGEVLIWDLTNLKE
jgi:WD40 repeat protein